MPVRNRLQVLDATARHTLRKMHQLEDGKTGLLVDEKTFKELVGGRAEAPPASQTQASVR